MGFPKMREPAKWMVTVMEKSVKMDDLGVSHDLGNLDIYKNDSTI